MTNQEGVIPNSAYKRFTVTGSSAAQVNKWLKTDLSMQFTNSDNSQAYKGDAGPLIGLLVWPATDNAKDYLSPAGTRRRATTLAANSELDNPYFNVNKNINNAKNSRLLLNVGITVTPFSWGELKTNIGSDSYTGENLILRNPESALGYTNNGILDIADDVTRNLNAQTLLSVLPHKLFRDISISGFVGHAIQDQKSTVQAQEGMNFLDPNFVSLNNTSSRTARTTITQRRLVSAFASASLD